MKLKRYFQFIKESKGDTNIWTLSESEIKEYLIDFIQSRYIINIEFGFTESFLKEDKTLKNVFKQDIKKYGEEETPSYYITLYTNLDPKNPTLDDDITDSLHFACDNFKELVGHGNLFGADVELHDDGGKLDIDDIIVKQGFFIKTDDDLLETEGSFGIFVIENKKVKMTAKDFCDYHGWKYDELKGDMVYAHIDVEDMASALLSRNSAWKKELTNGIDDRHFWSSDYQPDTASLFRYTLNKENSILLVKEVIKEIGGLEKTIEEIGNENLKDISEDKLIDFLLNERFYRTLESLCKDSEIVKEVKQTCGDWEMNACIEQNQKELWNEFINIVDKEIENYTIIEKEVTKYYTTSSGEKKEYKEVEKFFSIPLNNDWMENMDYDYKMKLGSVADVFSEWQADMYFNYDLEPNFSSSGDVDSAELNKEIRSILV